MTTQTAAILEIKLPTKHRIGITSPTKNPLVKNSRKLAFRFLTIFSNFGNQEYIPQTPIRWVHDQKYNVNTWREQEKQDTHRRHLGTDWGLAAPASAVKTRRATQKVIHPTEPGYFLAKPEQITIMWVNFRAPPCLDRRHFATPELASPDARTQTNARTQTVARAQSGLNLRKGVYQFCIDVLTYGIFSQEGGGGGIIIVVLELSLSDYPSLVFEIIPK